MMTPIATRFVDWDIPELSTLQDSKVYQLRVQLNEGTPMSRQQKNWLTNSVNVPEECSHNAHMYYIKVRDMQDRKSVV